MNRRSDRPMYEDILWLEDYLPYRLAVVAARMLRDAARVYKGRPDPLTTPQWRALSILANFEPLTAAEISRISMLDKVAISRALAQLESRGLLKRTLALEDRRERVVTLTAEGWRYYGELVPEMKRQEQALRDALSAAELRTLFRILEKLDRARSVA